MKVATKEVEKVREADAGSVQGSQAEGQGYSDSQNGVVSAYRQWNNVHTQGLYELSAVRSTQGSISQPAASLAGSGNGSGVVTRAGSEVGMGVDGNQEPQEENGGVSHAQPRMKSRLEHVRSWEGPVEAQPEEEESRGGIMPVLQEEGPQEEPMPALQEEGPREEPMPALPEENPREEPMPALQIIDPPLPPLPLPPPPAALQPPRRSGWARRSMWRSQGGRRRTRATEVRWV